MEISPRLGCSRRAQKAGDYSPARTFNTIHLMQFQQSLLRYASKSVYWLHRATTGKYRGLSRLQTDTLQISHS